MDTPKESANFNAMPSVTHPRKASGVGIALFMLAVLAFAVIAALYIWGEHIAQERDIPAPIEAE